MPQVKLSEACLEHDQYEHVLQWVEMLQMFSQAVDACCHLMTLRCLAFTSSFSVSFLLSVVIHQIVVTAIHVMHTQLDKLTGTQSWDIVLVKKSPELFECCLLADHGGVPMYLLLKLQAVLQHLLHKGGFSTWANHFLCSACSTHCMS